jgi:hypothetical protein
MQLRHASCHFYLKMRSRQPSVYCKILQLRDWSEPEPPLHHSHGDCPVKEELADSESLSPALRLIICLGQPFSVIVLAQQRGGEYKRIASDHDNIVQFKDMASVDNLTDIRALEIL